jgi:hypothetical protein
MFKKIASINNGPHIHYKEHLNFPYLYELGCYKTTYNQ